MLSFIYHIIFKPFKGIIGDNNIDLASISDIDNVASAEYNGTYYIIKYASDGEAIAKNLRKDMKNLGNDFKASVDAAKEKLEYVGE